MAQAKSVPVLFVSDPIVLPGMVVPITLDDTAQAAVDVIDGVKGQGIVALGWRRSSQARCNPGRYENLVAERTDADQ